MDRKKIWATLPTLAALFVLLRIEQIHGSSSEANDRARYIYRDMSTHDADDVIDGLEEAIDELDKKIRSNEYELSKIEKRLNQIERILDGILRQLR